MEFIGGELGFDGKLRRGRCISHTINLAAKALLFSNNPDAFEEQFNGAFALSYSDYQLWRIRGPVGKLHNLVVNVRNMHQLSYSFKKIQKKAVIPQSLRLIIDNNIRWLSQLYMIRRAIQLKTSLKTLLIVVKENRDRENRSKGLVQFPNAGWINPYVIYVRIINYMIAIGTLAYRF
jgi:hypothetical protein